MKEITKRRKRNYRIALLAHLSLLFAPVLIYLGTAFISVKKPSEGLAITAFTLMALVLSIVAATRHKFSRSGLWIILVGLYIVLDSFIKPLAIIALCQTVDELIIAPILYRMREKYHNGKDVEDYLD